MARAYEKNGIWLITVEVASHADYENGPFDFGSGSDGSFAEVMASLEAIREMIPEAYRSSARCQIYSGGGWEGIHFAKISVQYVRPATDEEVETTISFRGAQAPDQGDRDITAQAALRAKFGV